MKRDNFGVVLIDMQKYFCNGLDKSRMNLITQSQEEVLETCVKNDYPVAVLEMVLEGRTIPQLERYFSDLKRKEIVIKPWQDGFEDTKLEGILKKWGLDYILFMGINASQCVLETAKGGRKKGFGILTAEDLIADASLCTETKESFEWYKKKGALKKSFREYSWFE